MKLLDAGIMTFVNVVYKPVHISLDVLSFAMSLHCTAILDICIADHVLAKGRAAPKMRTKRTRPRNPTSGQSWVARVQLQYRKMTGCRSIQTSMTMATASSIICAGGEWPFVVAAADQAFSTRHPTLRRPNE
jgi:hypothetical protein